MSPTSLLEEAKAVLDGDTTLAPQTRPRAAALLVRCALEDIARERCAALGHQLDSASMRSTLVCLAVLDHNGRGYRASVAWAWLSRACHQHAYELSPTVAEVRHWWSTVRAMASRAGCSGSVGELPL